MHSSIDNSTHPWIETIGFVVAFLISTTIFYFVFGYLNEIGSWSYQKATLIVATITYIGLGLKKFLR